MAAQAATNRLALGLGPGARRAAEASASQGKAREFFREACRCLPWVIKNYKLEELTTVPELRANVNKLFRLNQTVTSPGAVDLLVYKGREELEMVIMQHKQRHHLIDRYVKNPSLDRIEKPSTISAFLEAFYKGN